MLSLVRRTETRLFPRGWGDALRQILLFAAAFLGYQLIRGLIAEQAAAATGNATKLTAGISALAAQRLFARARSGAWAFRPVSVEAPA